MLEARYLQRDSMHKQGQMENRIKRLVFEEQRAKKLTDIANEKAEKLLKARDRHQREMEEKLLREQEKLEEEFKRREANLRAKHEHMEKLR